MLDNFREFQAGPDPFGRMWQVHLNWLQTGISIRHADTVDVKFGVATDGQPFEERVIALPHPALLELSQKSGHPLTDAWCLKLAAPGNSRKPLRKCQFTGNRTELLEAPSILITTG